MQQGECTKTSGCSQQVWRTVAAFAMGASTGAYAAPSSLNSLLTVSADRQSWYNYAMYMSALWISN